MVNLPPAERRAAADRLGIDEQYLYQVLTGRRTPDPALAVRIENELGDGARRWDLRPEDWHLIWPELRAAQGAPKLGRALAKVA